MSVKEKKFKAKAFTTSVNVTNLGFCTAEIVRPLMEEITEMAINEKLKAVEAGTYLTGGLYLKQQMLKHLNLEDMCFILEAIEYGFLDTAFFNELSKYKSLMGDVMASNISKSFSHSVKYDTFKDLWLNKKLLKLVNEFGTETLGTDLEYSEILTKITSMLLSEDFKEAFCNDLINVARKAYCETNSSERLRKLVAKKNLDYKLTWRAGYFPLSEKAKESCDNVKGEKLIEMTLKAYREKYNTNCDDIIKIRNHNWLSMCSNETMAGVSFTINIE